MMIRIKKHDSFSVTHSRNRQSSLVGTDCRLLRPCKKEGSVACWPSPPPGQAAGNSRAGVIPGMKPAGTGAWNLSLPVVDQSIREQKLDKDIILPVGDSAKRMPRKEVTLVVGLNDPVNVA